MSSSHIVTVYVILTLPYFWSENDLQGILAVWKPTFSECSLPLTPLLPCLVLSLSVPVLLFSSSAIRASINSVPCLSSPLKNFHGRKITFHSRRQPRNLCGHIFHAVVFSLPQFHVTLLSFPTITFYAEFNCLLDYPTGDLGISVMFRVIPKSLPRIRHCACLSRDTNAQMIKSSEHTWQIDGQWLWLSMNICYCYKQNK